jgi:hypothetical protein
MHSRKIEEQKKKIRISRKMKEVIIGLLLGDGTLETQNNGKTWRLKVEHSIEQKEYVDWLYQQLKDLVRTPPKIRVRKDRGKIRCSNIPSLDGGYILREAKEKSFSS